MMHSPGLAVVSVRTAVWLGSDWPGEEEKGAEPEAERSALLPMKDLTRSRHCSANLNMRPTSTATTSPSSEDGTERKTENVTPR